MLHERGPQLPHAWIAGDAELGRPSTFRRRLARLGEQYLLAVPSNTLIRDVDASPPPYSGHGRRPKRPWQRVAHWAASLGDAAWTEVDVRNGAKGPLVVETVKQRVVGRTSQRQEGHAEVLVVLRYRDRDNQRVLKTDYYLSNAAPETELQTCARVAKAEQRIEECIQRSKSEAGLGDYEVRNWKGWHHHQTLSLIATWFFVTASRRGKKWTPAITVQQIREGIALILHATCRCATTDRILYERERRLIRNELARFYHWKQRNQLASLNLHKRRI